MSYFNTNIDNDIMYLLREIGHNCKINNVVAKAIINNASMERTFDDKKIITHEELRRGYYVEYNNLFFIVLNEVNDKRYLSYYKGIIRRCNFDIKFIIANKLYQFPSIIEGDKFFIQDNNIMPMSADTIMATLPLTQVTKQLKKQDAFIKWGQKWEIQGIDYTKDGLIVLTCKIKLKGNDDDLENEIADRYDSGNDKLKGDIKPILPFDIITKDIISVSAIEDITVPYSTVINDITLPLIVKVALDDNSTKQLNVEWDTSIYNGNVAETYNLIGTIVLDKDTTNNNKLNASINIIVEEEVLNDNYTIKIIGQDAIQLMSEQTYVAKVYNNGIEVTDKLVTWTKTTDLANVKSQDGNTITLSANTKWNTGSFKLKATLVDDGTVFAERTLYVNG